MGILRGSLQRWVIAICIAVSCIAGLAVAGWLIHSYTLLEVLPGLAPMQFNTALGLFVVSGAIAIQASRSAKYSRWLCVVLILLGGTTLFEWISGEPLFIDHLFFSGYISNLNSPLAGRMSPITASGFFVFGVALLARAEMKKDKRLNTAVTIACTATVLVFACTFTFGLLQSDLIYAGLKYNQVALHTSFCFVVLGIAAFCLNWRVVVKQGWTNQCLAATAIVSLMIGTVVVVSSRTYPGEPTGEGDHF